MLMVKLFTYNKYNDNNKIRPYGGFFILYIYKKINQMKIKAIFFFLFSLFSISLCSSQEKENNTQFPPTTGYINDFENIYTPEEIKELTEIISLFEKETENEIVVATIDNISNYDSFDKYTIDLSNYWGIGKPDKNNGLSIILSKKLRRVRINTGIGTQEIINDDFCQQLINKHGIPNYKEGNFFIGTKLMLLAIIEAWK